MKDLGVKDGLPCLVYVLRVPWEVKEGRQCRLRPWRSLGSWLASSSH